MLRSYVEQRVGWGERSDAHPTINKPSMRPTMQFSLRYRTSQYTSMSSEIRCDCSGAMVGIAALTPPYLVSFLVARLSACTRKKRRSPGAFSLQ